MAHSHGTANKKVHELAWDALVAGVNVAKEQGIYGTGAYNLPLYLSFADPMHSPGLMLSSSIGKGFTFVIVDEICEEGKRTIELNAPDQLYDIATLLRDNGRFVIESIWSRDTGEQAAVVSTLSRKIVGGKCRGKDDPVQLVRVQSQFPSSG